MLTREQIEGHQATFLFAKIAYFCPFIKIELHYMNLFCIFAL